MKRNITICDLCKRPYSEVDTIYRSGEGKLQFRWSIGSSHANGGASGDEDYDDLCVDCSERLREVIGTWKKEREAFDITGKQ